MDTNWPRVGYRKELHEWEGVQSWFWPPIAKRLPPVRKTPFLRAKRKGGRPRAHDSLAFNALLWILRSGGRWRDLPKKFGSKATAFRRLRRWYRGAWLENAWRAYLYQMNEMERGRWARCFEIAVFRRQLHWAYDLERIYRQEYATRDYQASGGPECLRVRR